MGEVIKIDDWLERKARPTRAEIEQRLFKVRKELADLSIQQMLLDSEEQQLKRILREMSEDS